MQTRFSSNCAATHFSWRALVCTAYQFGPSAARSNGKCWDVDSICICGLFTASPSRPQSWLETHAANHFKRWPIYSGNKFNNLDALDLLSRSNNEIQLRIDLASWPIQIGKPVATPSRRFPAIRFCDAYSSGFAVSFDSLIRPSTTRDARSEKVLNKKPLPTAENPLRLLPAIS